MLTVWELQSIDNFPMIYVVSWAEQIQIWLVFERFCLVKFISVYEENENTAVVQAVLPNEWFGTYTGD